MERVQGFNEVTTNYIKLIKLFERISPHDKEKSRVETLTDFILREELVTGELYNFINAIQVICKSIAVKIGRYNLNKVGDAFLCHEQISMPSAMTEELQFAKQLEELFINVLGDTGVVGYMISKLTDDVIKIECRIPGNYVLCFSVLDGIRNLSDYLPVGTIFSLYRLNPEGDLNLKDLKGDCIVTSGYAMYGACTLLVLAFGNNLGVHEFYLDQSVGEFALLEANKQIPRRGISYSINEGFTAGWDEATKIYVNRRKDPRFVEHSLNFYIGALTADVLRVLKTGGIFMYPANATYPEGKLALLYECNPVAFVMREASGYATDGWVSILDIEPQSQHQTVPFFAGSLEDVISIMELKTIYRARDF